MKKFIIMAALLFTSIFASASRFPASIQELEKDYTKRNIASVLTKHHTALDIVSKDLVEKHLKIFKVPLFCNWLLNYLPARTTEGLPRSRYCFFNGLFSV